MKAFKNGELDPPFWKALITASVRSCRSFPNSPATSSSNLKRNACHLFLIKLCGPTDPGRMSRGIFGDLSHSSHSNDVVSDVCDVDMLRIWMLLVRSGKHPKCGTWQRRPRRSTKNLQMHRQTEPIDYPKQTASMQQVLDRRKDQGL